MEGEGTIQSGKGHLIFALVLSVLAFALIAACLGGDEWLTWDIYWNWDDPYTESPMHAAFSMHSGLWRGCSTLTDGCEDIDQVNDAYKAVRAFIILGTISSVISVVLALMVLTTEKIKPWIASIFQFVTAGFVFIGLTTFINNRDDGFGFSEDVEFVNDYGWTFNCGWAGMSFAVIGGAVGLCRGKRRL